MRFTRDETKRLANLAKHDLDFADVGLVYNSVSKVTLPEECHGEHRFVDLAMVEGLGRILLPAYLLRGDEIRTISFRVAHRSERKPYEAHTRKPN